LAPAAAEKRVALVIGNAAYQHAPPLKNPSNDATDIAAKLRELGFDVVEGIDLGKRDMEKRIRAFAEQLNGADVGLFYYAGHGLQVNQKNFLAPVDAELCCRRRAGCSSLSGGGAPQADERPRAPRATS
jgi:uncharacterized caspase-like protein